MAESHILLLPEKDYYQWVRAARVYVLTFGVNITPDPVRAGRNDNVSVVIASGAYPDQGDILEWLAARFPQAKLDGIQAIGPLDLEQVLLARVESGQRFGLPAAPDEESAPPPGEEAPFRLRWPTDYRVITQAFGANPEIYSKWGLPGHEGVDIRAPMNTNVYAAADGDVYYVMQETDTHAYGRHIRIQHPGGYRTVYAHLASLLVSQGNKVRAGQLIGKADSTGNSSGSHLHLTLKKDGATARKETQFQGDVIDPTPFLYWPEDEKSLTEAAVKKGAPVAQPAWQGDCLVGVNLREDGTMQEADFEALQTARVEAVKIQENTSSSVINRLRQLKPDMFIMARVALDIGSSAITASEWVSRMRLHVSRLYKEGVQYFEIQQSPNLHAYGWNTSWHSGGGFARWWLDVIGMLRDSFPEVKFGFPGVSPGGQVEGQRLDAATFLEQADEAIHNADWLGANCFWSTEAEMDSVDHGAFWQAVRLRYPDKLIIITEFGNVNVMTNLYVKGNQYVTFYEGLRRGTGIAAAFSQILSSPKGYDNMQWRHEDGQLTRIPIQIGKREF
ncbi:MAG: peptidoglycan DD-metalloendopeptidase family protein [Chloroflexi bacterium]|nr:peptidoglycan DD-metalloendopeptidase family protein [Chloroflexota bacterium]